MYPLLKVFVDICRLRAGPQQLPASRFLLSLVLAAHAVLGLVFAMFSQPLAQSLLSALIGTALLFAVVQGLLLLHRKPARMMQTVTAQAGSEVLLGLLAMPLTLWFYAVEGDGARLIPSLLSLLLIVWTVTVTVHILRQALEVMPAVAVLLALGYTFLAYSAVGMVV